MNLKIFLENHFIKIKTDAIDYAKEKKKIKSAEFLNNYPSQVTE